jgi:multicomponent Na+:H+ antiporter subunit E
MIFAAAYFALWLSVWMLLSWPPDIKDLLTGVAAALFVSFMTNGVLRDTGPGPSARRSARAAAAASAWFLCYAAVFLWECVKANIDVAFRVLHPDIPIRPGTLRVKTGLRSDVGITFLANSVTLTPGTTTVDVDKERGYIYVHCLSIKEGQDGVPAVGRFERILKRIFE